MLLVSSNVSNNGMNIKLRRSFRNTNAVWEVRILDDWCLMETEERRIWISGPIFQSLSSCFPELGTWMLQKQNPSIGLDVFKLPFLLVDILNSVLESCQHSFLSHQISSLFCVVFLLLLFSVWSCFCSTLKVIINPPQAIGSWYSLNVQEL
jgi:hypothetical protein